MIAYFLIFTQVIVFFSSLSKININQKNRQSFLNEVISQEINLKKVYTVEVSTSINIEQCDEIPQDLSALQLISRDNLINCALKNLALGNSEEYSKQLFLAKKLDPNWIGWNK